jgi:TonB-dependent receptor
VLALLFGGVNAQQASITGKVTDAETGHVLPGANVLLMGTSLGAATGVDGFYTIVGAPPGSHRVRATYVGYLTMEVAIQVEPGASARLHIKMKSKVVEGGKVTVTAQAEGQIQAINQQLTAKTVTSVVSKAQIQELPEANAAEAVGRLPGVSLERNGGEGTKLLIRGMGAKYTTVQIDGVTMTATGEGDRSTDLSMISPYMLEGIELTKSVMANQEASATGGIVNFKIRKAPEKPTFNAIVQGGYNDVRNTYRDFKVSSGASHRFYANLLGVYAQVDYEEKDAGSQQMGGVWFSQENETAPVKTNGMNLMDTFRNVRRLGGAVVLDYSLPSAAIKTSNFYSRIHREETRYTNNYGFTQQNFSIGYEDTPKSWLTVLTNSVQADLRRRNWEISSSFSHSYSENILPARIGSSNGNSPSNPFPPDRKSDFNSNIDPETIPHLMTFSMDKATQFMYLGSLTHNESETRERDLAAEVNLAYTLNLTDRINVKFSMGGKYKHKTKVFDQTSMTIDGEYYLNLVYDTFKNELGDRTRDSFAANNQFLLIEDFWDQTHNSGDFLGGKYLFSPVFDKKEFRRIHDLAMATYDPTNTAIWFWDMVKSNFINSTYFDFDGQEDYSAGYFMPEISITSRFLFVPGVRYERHRTEYTGYRGNRLGVLRDFTRTPVDTVTKVRTGEFVLPMIQAFYKPMSWLTFKAGYTHTLQHPDYNNIMPGWVISSLGQIDNLSNFRLKPEMSRNWDLQMSIHSHKVGLLSVGAFHKKITDMIFWTGQKAVTDIGFFELPQIMNRQRAAWAVNNQYPASNYGYEVEWQSNFWHLPGLLKGLVVNVNFTRNESEARYLRTRIKMVVDPKTYKTTLVNQDTTYTNPMISQPDHLLNLTLGYDYRGFSIRSAMRYSSRIFRSNNWYETLRGYSTPFYRYDLSIKQRLPVKGMEFFLNVNNLTGEMERDVINHMNFASYVEDYGRSANVGVRYQF